MQMTEATDTIPFRLSDMDPTKLAIEANKLDMMAFENMLVGNEALDGLTARYSEKGGPTVKELANDFANSLLKHDPKLKGKADITPSHRHNRGFVQRGMQTAEYERLREHTVGQRFETEFATMTILDAVMGALDDEDLEKMKDQGEQAESLQDQIEQMENRAEGLQEAIKAAQEDNLQEDRIEGMMERAREASNSAQAAQQQLEELVGEMDQTNDALGQQVRVAMRTAMEQAADEAETMAAIGSGWGLGPGQLQKLPLGDKARLAEELKKNKKLLEIAKMLGRMKRIALQKRTEKYSKAPEEIVDIEIGDDLSRLVTSEAALLADEETEILFFQKYVEKKLVLYKMRGKDKEGQGPIISCVDTSGSMALDRETWAKAMTLSLLEVAGKEKRDFAVIYFGGRDEKTIFKVPHTIQGTERFELVMDIATYGFHGGTDFETPINEARKLIEEQEFKKADIVMITDGECNVSDAWLGRTLEWRNEQQVLIQGIYVDAEPGWRTMEKFCQETYTIWDILDTSEQNKTNKVYRMMN